MREKNVKRAKNGIRALIIICGIAVAAGSGCAGREGKEKRVYQEEVKIPITLIVDSSTGNKNEQELVEAFNREYQGIYQVEAQWIMETEEEYRRNLKRQNVTDQLPAIITDLRMLPSFYERMIADGRIEDLSPYIEKDAEWRQMIEDVVLEGCSEPDGKIYLAPLSTAAFSCSGVFWNEELFSAAGIGEFPRTWEEFWDCCDRLRACGITPLALHTDGTAWAPMLFATAELAKDEQGTAFMKQLYPDSYRNESGLQIARTLKRLFAYTTEDAMHNDFDVSYNHFFAGDAAMIPNGYWMMDQIPEEWAEKVRFSPFPENKLISSPETFGWSVVSGYGEDVKEGAVTFFKFRTKMNQEEKEQLFAKDAAERTKAENDYIQAYERNPQIVPNYQVKWNSILQEDTLRQYLPELAAGQMTEEEFTEKEDESIRQFEEDREEGTAAQD